MDRYILPTKKNYIVIYNTIEAENAQVVEEFETPEKAFIRKMELEGRSDILQVNVYKKVSLRIEAQ